MVHLHPTLHLLEPLQMLRLAVVYFDRELKKDFCVSEENFSSLLQSAKVFESVP